MNILIFCYEFPPLGGGAGNAAYYLSREWAKAGHKVTVVTSGFDCLEKSENVDGISIKRLDVGRKSVFKARLIEMFRYVRASIKDVPSLYAEIKPDLCVAFMAVPGGPAALEMKKKYGVPFITEARGGDVPGYRIPVLVVFHALAKPLLAKIWGESRTVIANSHGLARLLERGGFSVKPKVISNGVDCSRFSPAPVYGGKFRVLYAGRLVDSQKKISLLIRAVSFLPDAELLIAGDGPDEDSLRKSVKRLNVENRVLFPGWLQKEALAEAYRKAGAYASASVFEGMPNSALEAMASGLPLVLSKIGGHDELCRENENGFLFETGDEAALLDRLRRLSENPALRRAMGKESRRIAETEYDWRVLAGKHLQ